MGMHEKRADQDISITCSYVLKINQKFIDKYLRHPEVRPWKRWPLEAAQDFGNHIFLLEFLDREVPKIALASVELNENEAGNGNRNFRKGEVLYWDLRRLLENTIMKLSTAKTVLWQKNLLKTSSN